MHLLTRDSQERDLQAALEDPNASRSHIYSPRRIKEDKLKEEQWKEEG